MTRLNDAIADHALLDIEGQQTLFSTVGFAGLGWEADLVTGRIELTGARGDRHEYRVGLLGSYSLESKTWRWGWANRSLADRECAQFAAPLAARADALGIPELAAESGLSLRGVNDLGRAPASGIASLAAQLLGAQATYLASTGTGQLYFALLDLPRPHANPVRMASRLEAAQAVATGNDRRLRLWQALRLYGARRSLVEEELDFDRIKLRWPCGSSALVRFDPIGRLQELKLDLHPGDVPPALPYEIEVFAA